MNNRAFTISVTVALLAVLMVHSYVTSSEESYKRRYGTMVSIVFAKKDIKELELLNETNLELRQVPQKFVHKSSSRSVESLEGLLAVVPILKDEPVTRSKVTQLGLRTGLSRQIAVGKRAVTVKVNSLRAVAQLLKPGDRVDILTEIDPGRGDISKKEVVTVLQDILVLATGKYVTNSTPGILERSRFKKGKVRQVNLSEYSDYNNVTLEVDPYEAQKLIWIEKNKGVFLTLRNNDDNVRSDVRAVKVKDVIGRSLSSGQQN